VSALVPILDRPVGDEANSVNARQLHAALGVGKVFAAWIRERIEQLGLTENVDFVVFSDSGNNPLGGRPSIEYAVTLDAAKHLAMAERNDAGRAARAYFIEAEKKLRAVAADPLALLADPARLRALLGSYAERVQSLESTVAEQAPKVAIFDRIIESSDTFGFREAAQQVKAATGANENEFRGLMRSRGWVQRLGTQLAPAHVGTERGYVTTRERSWTDDTGASRVRPELRVTPKGIARAIEILLEQEAA
jgi:anti-repressor protein